MKALIGILILVLLPLLAFSGPTSTTLAPAIANTVSAAPSVAPAPVVAQDPSVDFLTQVLNTIKNFGGLSTLLKAMAIITLLIASMKVSILNQLIWSKFGDFQSLVAPALAVIAGVLGLYLKGAPVTLATLAVFFGTGMGAVALHELLDDIKAIPGIGPKWVSIIAAIESVLGGPASQEPADAPPTAKV